jgi:hypothetical protein
MLRTLMHREWREVRGVTLGAAIAAVIASVAVDGWFLHGKDGALTAVWVVPALLALYLAILASDLVAGDVATDRIRAMALLHENLYRSGNLAQVNMEAYLGAVCQQFCVRGRRAPPGRSTWSCSWPPCAWK